MFIVIQLHDQSAGVHGVLGGLLIQYHVVIVKETDPLTYILTEHLGIAKSYSIIDIIVK